MILFVTLRSRARKARERDARRVEEERKEAALSSKRSNASDRRKFGAGDSAGQAPRGGVPTGGSGGAGNELAAAMARRRAAVAGDS